MIKDRFSGQASKYAAFRPRYPQALYNFLFKQVKAFDMAWDAGTGNGQAAEEVAKRFKNVLATDMSAKQLEQATKLPNIRYEVAGETTNLPDRSVDLVTVAQAIHWLDRTKFTEEVKRVAKPGAVVAVWVYGLLKTSDDIDPLLRDFCNRVVGPYWDPERKIIDDELKSIEFPFIEFPVPQFSMTISWTLAELEGYLSTWSAVQKYMKAEGRDPVPEVIKGIGNVWKSEKAEMKFPLTCRMGIIP